MEFGLCEGKALSDCEEAFLQALEITPHDQTGQPISIPDRLSGFQESAFWISALKTIQALREFSAAGYFLK
ncbi:MAG: hypothetical protein H0X30_09095 [Anaerolineae bacterium]|nr:hypothetical protein [Anaerolineae bacterium]